MGLIVEKKDRLLIIAPHPDDETIGCGGIIALFPGQCDVLLVTDGYEKEKGDSSIGQIRNKEFTAAMDLLGVDQRIMLHLSENCIFKNRDSFGVIDYSKYKYIFVPGRNEDHKDHTDVYKLTKKLILKKAKESEIIEYEVWTALSYPNIKIDISSVASTKIEAIGIYRSQIKELDYVGMALGLNAYRGKRSGFKYAEAFFSEKRARIQRRKDLKKRLKRILFHTL